MRAVGSAESTSSSKARGDLADSLAETDPDQTAERLRKQLSDMRRGLRSESNPTARFVEVRLTSIASGLTGWL